MEHVILANQSIKLIHQNRVGVVTNITTTTTTTTTRSVYIDPGHTSPSGVEHGGGGSRR